MEYVPVRVSTLRGEQKIPFNLHIKIGSKYILYIRNGDSFEGTRLSRLKEKKLRKMFITPEEEAHYRGYMSKNIEMAYDKNSGMSLESRSEIVQGLQQTTAEEVMEDPSSKESYDQAKSGAARYVDFLLNENNALQNILNMTNTDKSIAHHGVAVGTFAVALAQKLGIDDDEQLKLLTLGCLVHDMEHFRSGRGITSTLEAASPEELKVYQEHPTKGAEYVTSLEHFDKPVIDIILEHEEHIDGSGYPKKRLEKNLNPLSVIAATANAMDRYISFDGISKEEAAKKMMIDRVGRHPLKHLQLMQQITKTL